MAQGEPPGRFDPARFKQFDFAKNDRKVSEFIQWLEDQQDLGIFGVSRNIPMDQAADRMWQNIYIDQGYQKGIQRAIQEAKRAGYEVPWEDTPAVQLMNQPYHADAVGLIHTRAYSDLRGITQAMDTQISRVLAEGLAAGISPRELADRISHVVDTVGINRARTLARTEVVRAHHIAMMNEFERAQVSGVAVKSEWDTANDGRVCPICAALEGRIFRLGEIRDMIPRHPNCRCVALPVTPDTNPEEF
jgi:SPP1 gp7 family putative phage head morphogenesis protein